MSVSDEFYIAVAKILRHKIHHKPNPEGDTPVTVSTHESATYGSAISRTCIQCCARTFGLYYTPDLDPTSPRHIACLVPGLCPLRSSPVLIRSSGPRDRRESNPRLRSMMNFSLKFIITRTPRGLHLLRCRLTSLRLMEALSLVRAFNAVQARLGYIILPTWIPLHGAILLVLFRGLSFALFASPHTVFRSSGAFGAFRRSSRSSGIEPTQATSGSRCRPLAWRSW